jgi:hypothetical protein
LNETRRARGVRGALLFSPEGREEYPGREINTFKTNESLRKRLPKSIAKFGKTADNARRIQ